MGVLRRSYFFADLQTILQEYGLACKNFFNLYNKVGRNGWDSAAAGIVGKSKLLDFTNKSKLRRNPNFPLQILYSRHFLI